MKYPPQLVIIIYILPYDVLFSIFGFFFLFSIHVNASPVVLLNFLIINHALICCFRLLLVDLLAIFRRFGRSCGLVPSLMLFCTVAVGLVLIFALQVSNAFFVHMTWQVRLRDQGVLDFDATDLRRQPPVDTTWQQVWFCLHTDKIERKTL